MFNSGSSSGYFTIWTLIFLKSQAQIIPWESGYAEDENAGYPPAQFSALNRYETEQLWQALSESGEFDPFLDSSEYPDEIVEEEERKQISSDGEETDTKIRVSKRNPVFLQNPYAFDHRNGYFPSNYFKRAPRKMMVSKKKVYRKRAPRARKLFRYLPGYGNIDMSTTLLRNLHRSKLRSRTPLFGRRRR